MALVKNNLVVDDSWTVVEDTDNLPDGNILVTLEQWQNNREQLMARANALGIFLNSDEHPDQIVDDLNFFQVIALNFPVFGDGRAYSYARLLRERHGYDGELRAVGNVLRDQLLYMHRCGFDAFEVPGEDAQALKTWLDAQSEMSVFYQPTADGRKTVMSLRDRRRLAQQG